MSWGAGLLRLRFNQLAEQASECSPGWSEAEPWDTSPTKSCEPAVAGDRVFRPLPRAHEKYLPRFPGFASLHPGLHSAAGFAGSLNSPVRATEPQ